MTAAQRRLALAGALPDDVDGILVTKLVNVRYLTGFTGSNAAVVVRRDGDGWFATDGRYVEQARAETSDLRLVETRTLGPDLVRQSAADGLRRLAIERHHVTLAAHDALRSAAEQVELVGVGEPVEGLRVRKDDDEIRSLAEACAVTDAAFAAILPLLRPGITEVEVAWQLLTAMRAHGAEAAAFDSIVAFGPHSAIPHHQPTTRELRTGDLVKLDFGARVDGYHADMTRTVVCGRAADWQRDLHAHVERIQAACRGATVPGARPDSLDDLARGLVAATGHQLVHGLGHGVGLEIHEQPFLVPATRADTLVDRVPVTVEPGIYLPGQGGIRIEDTVLVAPGGAHPLTASPRDLVEI